MTAIKNALYTTYSSCLDAGKVLASELTAADAGAKFGKTLLSAYEEIGRHCGYLIPASFLNLKAAFVQLNNLSSLFGPFTRFSEYIQDGWKSENKSNYWVGTGDGYKGKALLSAAQAVEAVRILQANYILPVTDHLFTAMGRVPVFQTAATWMRAFPYGATVSNVAMKVTGLEMIKNILLLASAYYGIRKNKADIQAATRKHEKGLIGQGKWAVNRHDSIQAFLDRKANFIRDLRSKKYELSLMPNGDAKLEAEVSRLQGKQDRLVKKYGNEFEFTFDDNKTVAEDSVTRLASVVYRSSFYVSDDFIKAQKLRSIAKDQYGRLDQAKATRGLWKEYSKTTVISFVCGIPFGILANPVILGAFTTVLFVSGIFTFWCIRQDKKDEQARKMLAGAGIKEIPAAKLLADFMKPQPSSSAPSSSSHPQSSNPTDGLPEVYGSSDEDVAEKPRSFDESNITSASDLSSADDAPESGSTQSTSSTSGNDSE